MAWVLSTSHPYSPPTLPPTHPHPCYSHPEISNHLKKISSKPIKPSLHGFLRLAKANDLVCTYIDGVSYPINKLIQYVNGTINPLNPKSLYIGFIITDLGYYNDIYKIF